MNDDSQQVVRTSVDAMGRHWVRVSPREARGHPKGRPNFVLIVMGAWFAASGGLEVALMLGGSLPLWAGALGIASLLTGVGLILGVPWAYVPAVVLPARHILGFMQTIGGGALATMGQNGDIIAALALVQAVISFFVIFYLIEGERPNLVYRHRYRSFDAERQVDKETEE